jgi:hypothetical protein
MVTEVSLLGKLGGNEGFLKAWNSSLHQAENLRAIAYDNAIPYYICMVLNNEYVYLFYSILRG